MTGKVITISEDKKLILVDLKEPALKIKLDDSVEVHKTRTIRTLKQNAMYYVFLEYCIEKGLKGHGHFSVDGLHEDVKAWMQDAHKLEFQKGFSTADMGLAEFSRYFEIVDRELMNQFFGIDTSKFFQDYEDFKAWESVNPDGTFRKYLGARI
jgi:hypothetical protein